MGVHLQVRTGTEYLIQTAGRMKVTGRRQRVHRDLDSVGAAGMWHRRIVGYLTDRPLGRLIRVEGLIMVGEGLGRRRSIINRHAYNVSLET